MLDEAEVRVLVARAWLKMKNSRSRVEGAFKRACMCGCGYVKWERRLRTGVLIFGQVDDGSCCEIGFWFFCNGLGMEWNM